jgi:hypothetical protein
MGHTAMSNEDYTEIKENPALGYERLAEILSNSPITKADYEDLLQTARARQAKKLQKKKREELEQRLSSMLSPKTPEKSVASQTCDLSQTAEISIVSDTPFALYDKLTTDEPWKELEEEMFDDGVRDKTDEPTPSQLIEYAQFGGGDDFDANAARENLTRTIVCLVLGIVVAFSSVFVRYLTTGGWWNYEFVYRPPQSYVEVFELKTEGQPRSVNRVARAEETLFRAENFHVNHCPLLTITSSESYIFRVEGNTIRSVEIDAGDMENGVVFTPPEHTNDSLELHGIFIQNNRLFAVYSKTEQINLTYYETDIETYESVQASAIYTQPRVVVYEFEALRFIRTPLAVYTFEGELREVLLRENGFFITADYVQRNSVNPDELTGFIPAYSVGEYHTHLPIENIAFIRDAAYTDMTLIAAIHIIAVGNSEFTLYAVSGNTADYIHHTDNSLIMAFYCTRASRSDVLRFVTAGNSLRTGDFAHTNINGRVGRGFIDERRGLIRIVADTGNSSTLHLLNTDLSVYAPPIRNLAGGIGLSATGGVAFDSSVTYIIAEQIYAVDTSDTDSPVFLGEINTLIADCSVRHFYAWCERRFFEIDTDFDDEGEPQGLQIIMYVVDDNDTPVIERIFPLPIFDAVWHDYTRTPAEHMREAVGVFYDHVIRAGVIVIPVTYFNAVSRVEKFIVLNYSEEYGFVENGRILELGFRSRFQGAVVQDGYIYAFWDSLIRSTTFDAMLIGQLTVA